MLRLINGLTLHLIFHRFLQFNWTILLYVHTEKRGLLGTGTGGMGTKEWRLDRGYRPKKTGETVDHRQNNGSVKAVSPRHCPATSALRNCCFNCRAWAESQGQCPLHCCWGTTRSERSPTFAAQLHLPTHDLFWANLKVQLHLPPLDLLIFWSRLEPCGRKFLGHSHTKRIKPEFATKSEFYHICVF